MSKLRWYNISLYKRNRLCLIQRDHSTSDSDVSNSSILESFLRFCWEPSRPLTFFRASSENTLDLLNKFPNSLTSHEIISHLDIALQLYFSLNLAIISCFTPIVFFCLFVCLFYMNPFASSSHYYLTILLSFSESFPGGSVVKNRTVVQELWETRVRS